MGKESSTLFVGYVIQRHLCAQGLHCDVVAPSSIARPPGARIKTDRRDAMLLARLAHPGSARSSRCTRTVCPSA